MEIKLNTLPSPTWNWLKMNEAEADIGSFEEAQARVRKPAGFSEGSGEFTEISCGLGGEIEKLTSQLNVEKLTVSSDTSEPLFIRPEFANNSCQAKLYEISVKDNVCADMIIVINAGKTTGTGAVLLKLRLGKGAKLHVSQLCAAHKGFTVLSGTGAQCEDGAQLSASHIVIGGGEFYLGCDVQLAGQGAALDTNCGYFIEGGKLDINFTARHTGKQTQSSMNASGALSNGAFKTLRQTIDFVRGASGAKGAESDDSLLLSDDVVNQTIPLILCEEEDVEGVHGATIGRLGEDVLYYLGSRGLSESEIYLTAARGRVEAAARDIPDECTRAEIRALLGGDEDE